MEANVAFQTILFRMRRNERETHSTEEVQEENDKDGTVNDEMNVPNNKEKPPTSIY